MKNSKETEGTVDRPGLTWVKDIMDDPNEDINNYEDGISVITPSYQGEEHILRLLESMKDQKLSHDRFEHIIIINGELDSTPQIIDEFKEKNPQMNIEVLFSEVANASHARNIGIEVAKRKYSTLIDDDDFISPSYLKELYENSSPDRIVVAGFYDVDEETGKVSQSYLTHETQENSGEIEDPYRKLVASLTINVIKSIPTPKIKQVKYNTTLGSGLDVAFYSRLFSKFNFKFYVIDKKKKAIYYRVTRENSLSRRPLSYGFNVHERLLVITDLNESMSIAQDDTTKKFLKSKIRAQTLFIQRYLAKNPQDIGKVRRDVKDSKLNYFPYDLINKGLAKKLIVSYNFPPYSSTSGNNMAKRVSEQAEIVDVVHNQVKRDMDENLNRIAEKYIDEKILTCAPYSFGGWNGIKEFCKQGMEKIEKFVQEKGEYEEIYSRAMFPASHFLAFTYKTRYPHVKWTAEFSDPIIHDIKGNVRGASNSLVDHQFMDRVNDSLVQRGFPEYRENNLFFLCEYLPYVFADELVFTNENQKKYMIANFPYPEIADIIEEKSVVHAHSIPKKEFYHVEECNYPLNKNYINIAYFGAFYETRNLNDVFISLYSLSQVYKGKCRIHFFTSNPQNFKNYIECTPVKDNIKVNPYVGFFEFLNLTTKFDCLIVNDALTKGYKEINPYLPSKLSDYLGSGSDIWMIYEEGSVMSTYDVKYKSKLDDFHSIKTALEQIIKDNSQKSQDLSSQNKNSSPAE